MTITTYSATRKADRAALAEKVRALAESLGAEAEIKIATYAPRQTYVHIEAVRGLSVSVCLNASSDDTHVLSWHVRGDTRLRVDFGGVNTYHFRKATHTAYGFDALLASLAQDLGRARDGTAFQSDSPT